MFVLFFLLISAIHSVPLLSGFYVSCTISGAKNRVENKVFFFRKFAFQWERKIIVE